MEKISSRIREILAGYAPQLERIEEQELVHKPSPAKWSKKEILGHLVDSAQNNLRRFIVARYEDTPYIVYQQDQWVSMSYYQHYPTHELISLWTSLNLHLCRVLEHSDAVGFDRLCRTNDPEPHTIRWLAEDYIKHLMHHLHQVLNLEPIAYP